MMLILRAILAFFAPRVIELGERIETPYLDGSLDWQPGKGWTEIDTSIPESEMVGSGFPSGNSHDRRLAMRRWPKLEMGS